jgi:hypothetical protein
MDVDDPPSQSRRKKKCHGNRKDQRFRKKCRKRGMKSARIEQLLNEQKQMNMNQQNSRRAEYFKDLMYDTYSTTEITMKQNLNKRKRDISLQDIASTSAISKSISTSSIQQPSRKKSSYQRSTAQIPVIAEQILPIKLKYRFVLNFY